MSIFGRQWLFPKSPVMSNICRRHRCAADAITLGRVGFILFFAMQMNQGSFKRSNTKML